MILTGENPIGDKRSYKYIQNFSSYLSGSNTVSGQLRAPFSLPSVSIEKGALHYKPWVGLPMVSWNFFLDIILSASTWPVMGMGTRNIL